MKTPIALAIALLCAMLAPAARSAEAVDPTQGQDVAAKLKVREAEITAIKAQIAEYVKIVQTGLPVITAELAALYRPLAVGEKIGKLEASGGRVFPEAIVMSIGTNSITIRSERSAATIAWKDLPRLFQVRAAHAILAAANVATATEPQAPAIANAEPVGDHVYLGEIKIREIKTGGDYTYYAWTAVIGNPTESGVTENTKIFLLDREKFQIEDGTGEKQYIPPHSFRTLSGDGMVETSIWKQMDSYRVIIY